MPPPAPPPLRVLLLGATGNFGTRLAARLASEIGVTLLPAARRAAPLRALADALGLDRTLAIERDALSATVLLEHGIDAVIDASGPFQHADTSLVAAAIGAGAHYIDLADGRDFVAGIGRFDAAARATGVAVVSGASSTPALSHAVVDGLREGWQRIDHVAATIGPSNRQRVGLAVVRAILDRAGQPMRVFEGGGWRTAHGWGATRRLHVPGVGGRWASLVETPDLDLFAARYRPRGSARFEAALGLPLQHLALAALSLPVRLGAVRSLAPLAPVLHGLVNAMRRLGTDRGFMEVRVEGLDAQGRETRARWRLIADGDSGPQVPTLAALALVRRLRDGRLGFVGATPCVGLLSLADFEGELARLGIRTETSRTAQSPPCPDSARACSSSPTGSRQSVAASG